MDLIRQRWLPLAAVSINRSRAMTLLRAKPLTAEQELLFYRNWISSLNYLKRRKVKRITSSKESSATGGWLFYFKNGLTARHHNKGYFCKMGKVKIGLVQMSCTDNKDENLQKAIHN